MNGLNEFFKEERKRVYQPGPFFTQRVMSRLKEPEIAEVPIWEGVTNAARLVFALALILIVTFAAADMFFPQMPQRGMIEAYLEPEQDPGSSFLYTGTELPGNQELLDRVLGFGDPQQ
jgi:hypothetical protein